MPSREQIQTEIVKVKSAGQDTIRRNYLKKLHKIIGNERDIVIYFSSFGTARPFPVPSQALTIVQDDIQGFMASLHGLKSRKLDLILHSPGGSLEAADQIVQYLRSKYDHSRAIIPQNAMSAATMIACACDEIVMGRHSAIGPIDPQIMSTIPVNGQLIQVSLPAHTILKDFEQAKTEVTANPQLANLWVPKLLSVPLGFLNLCDQTIKLAQQKVESWLSQYMFKGQSPEKAKEIAEWLGKFDEHGTHGRPIGYDLAFSKGLKVKRLEENQHFQEAVLSAFHATMATFQMTTCLKIIENQNGKGWYLVANMIPPMLQVNPPVQQ